jgi:uncharacterized protein (DUF169 family)
MTMLQTDETTRFLEALGHDEEPMGIFYSDVEPTHGIAPKPGHLPTREEEQKAGGAIDWQALHKGWSCVLGNLRLARKKKTAAYFEAGRFGCLGGAFFLGFNKPQLKTVVHFVSTGIPNRLEGERYFPSPEAARKWYEELDPDPAPKRFCVFKPLSAFGPDEQTEFVTFFARPEVISGLHQLTLFVTGDPESVTSPWGAGCTNLITWPRRYLKQGRLVACLGGWDPSCRKFLKYDEITFTIPLEMYRRMLDQWPDTFLTTKTWEYVKKRAAQSRKTWGEEG